MTNLEYLNKMKKEDVKFDESKRNRGMSEIGFRKAKALEIIAEELILAVRELKVLIKAVRGKI